MTVATKLQPNYTTQQAAAYKAAIDGMFSVHDRLAGAFSPHEQDVGSPAPDLSMRVDAGAIFSGNTLTEVAAQTVTGFTVPSVGEERIDRVVIHKGTGAAVRIAGTAVTGSPSAVPPTITDGYLPCCQIRFTSSTTSILNSMITDERVGPVPAGFVSAEQTITSAGSLTLAHGLGAVPKRVAVRLRCTSAEGNYSINDLVFVSETQQSDSAADTGGVSIVPDATNLNIRFGSRANVFTGTNKTTGGGLAITNASWVAVFLAWSH